jgi:hypothetical protein
MKNNASEVKDGESLVRYLSELRENLNTNPEEWESLTLDDYLEAMTAFVQDGGLRNEENPYAAIARAVTGGKIYE